MIRESTDVDARQAVMVVSPTNGIAWQYRHNVGGAGGGRRRPRRPDRPGLAEARAARATGSPAPGRPTASPGPRSGSTDDLRWGRRRSSGSCPRATTRPASTAHEFADVAVSRRTTVAATGTLSAMSTLLGEASAAQAIAVSGSALTAPVVATAPAGFEVAVDGVTFGPTAQFTAAGGVVSGTLSVRLAASAAAGSYAGNVALTSTGAAPVTVAIPESTVLQAVSTLAFASKTSSAIGIEWTAAAAATGYRIERSQDGTDFTTARHRGRRHARVYRRQQRHHQCRPARQILLPGGRPLRHRPSPLHRRRSSPPPPPAVALPAPWTAFDLGSVAAEGATGLQSGTFVHVSSGTAIGGPADSFRFTSQPLVRRRLDHRPRVTPGNHRRLGQGRRHDSRVNRRRRQAGGDGRLAGQRVAWQYRHNVGGNGVTTVVAADQAAPVWLKLTREGNLFTGSWSTDGVTWTEAGSTTVAMGPTAVIGLVSTSDEATRLNRSEFTDVSVSVTGGQPVDPVNVTGVFVRGTGWTSGYLARTPFTTLDGAALGWQLPDGSAQLANASNVSWNNVDVVSVRFDQPIAQPAADALQLVLGTAGGNQTILPTAAPTLLAGDTVAQWTLPAAIASGRYVISIASAGITNAAGTATLDGEWTTSTSSFAAGSGDGTAGGIFNFFFNVLVGDVNGNGTMNPTDISTIRSSLTSPFTTSLQPDSSDYRLDINGSNGLNSADLSQSRSQLTSAFGTALSSLPQVTAPAESVARSTKSFAALAEGSGTGGGTLASGLSADVWAWYGIETGSTDDADEA